jgi:nitrate reductase gamma subunit
MIFGYHPLEGGYDVPMRIVGANIPYEWLIYIFMFIPIGVLLYGIYKRYQVWTLAKGEIHRNDQVGARILSWLGYTFAQARVIRKPLAGMMHALLFWGFVVLALAAGVDAAHYWIGWPHIEGASYIGFSLFVDVLGLLALIGIIGLAIVRYIQKPDRLNDNKASDGWIILLVFVVLFFGFVIEGLRIAAQIKLSTTMEQIAYEQVAIVFNPSSRARNICSVLPIKRTPPLVSESVNR